MCHTSNEYHVAPGVPCRKTKPLQSQQLTAKALAASSEEEKHGQKSTVAKNHSSPHGRRNHQQQIPHGGGGNKEFLSQGAPIYLY